MECFLRPPTMKQVNSQLLFGSIVLFLWCWMVSMSLNLEDTDVNDTGVSDNNTLMAARERKLTRRSKLKIVARDGEPLGACEGSCSVDEDCDGDLSCFHRLRKEKVPGCRGRGEFGVDYCSGVPLNSTQPTITPTTTPPNFLSASPSASTSNLPSSLPTNSPSLLPAPTLSPSRTHTIPITCLPEKHFPSKVEGPYQMPLVGVAAAQLPGGKVLFWSAYSRYTFKGGTGAGKTLTAMFDPVTGNSEETLVVNTRHDMFCPGTASMRDGSIMISGGSTSRKVTFYDPTLNVWSIGTGKLKISRGYHAMTSLSDGSVFTHGGSWSGNKDLRGNKDAEIWSNESGTWTVLPGIKDGPFLTNDARGAHRSDNHMWLYQAPNGRIFHAGPSKQMHWIDVHGSGSVVEAGERGDDTDAMCGNAVMFDVGLILTVGGSLNYDSGDSSKRAYIIDINGDNAIVGRVGDMYWGRTFHNSVVLPSGQVVVVGGQSTVAPFRDKWSVRVPELWSPTTGEFSKLDSKLSVPRNYHSTGLLLKDGRVLVAGGGLCGEECRMNHADAEIITPPYLLNADGSPAKRPEILNSPSEFSPGGNINVTMDIHCFYTFALIRLGTATHATNNDQRRIPLGIVGHSNGGRYSLAVPDNPHVVLPGRYYLFAMNGFGVPSHGVDMLRTPP